MSDVGEFVKAVKEWPARYFVALGLVSGSLLIAANTRWADALGLGSGPPWFRLALTVSTLALFAIAFAKGIDDFNASRKQRTAARERQLAFEREMRNLTPDEYAAIAAFVDHDKKTVGFPFTSGNSASVSVAQALAMRGHLYSVSEDRNAFFTVMTYGIQQPVFDFFKKHRELLEPGRQLRKSEEKRLKENQERLTRGR